MPFPTNPGIEKIHMAQLLDAHRGGNDRLHHHFAMIRDLQIGDSSIDVRGNAELNRILDPDSVNERLSQSWFPIAIFCTTFFQTTRAIVRPFPAQ